MTTLLPETSTMRRLRDLGLFVCRCADPLPEPVYLWGTVLLDDAYECRRCRRKVVTMP